MFRTGKAGPIALAILLCAIHFGSFDVSTQPIVTDVRYFLYYAWRVAEGAIPHLDFFENKPQLPTFAGALLYRIGTAFEIDPLLSIRTGYLTLAAVGGLLMFAIFRRLGRASSVAGLLGLLAYCSFGLLGALPAVGNVPKLALAVLASAMALWVHDRRWLLAGLAGGLAFFDWQMGAVVWLAAAISAVRDGRPRQAALLSVTAGGVLGVAPLLAYYTATGALGATYQQLILSTLARGSAAVQSQGVLERLGRIVAMLERACPQHEWLFFTGLAGCFVLASWLLRERASDRGRLLLPLAVVHGVLVGFCLVDFQSYGDFFLLLHSVAFLLGLVWLAIFEAGSRWVSASFPENRRAAVIFSAVLLLATLAVARPGPLRPRLEIETAVIEPGGVLADQREVADALTARMAGQTLVLLDSSELLFLMRHENPLQNIYWNRAVRSALAQPGDGSPADTLLRLLESVEPDAYIVPERVRAGARLAGFSPVRLVSRNGLYGIDLLVREDH